MSCIRKRGLQGCSGAFGFDRIVYGFAYHRWVGGCADLDCDLDWLPARREKWWTRMNNISVQNRPGARLLKGWWHPVVNVWRDGRIIASETMSDKYPMRADALKAAKSHCETVDTIVRAALTPVTVTKAASTDDNPMNENISTATL